MDPALTQFYRQYLQQVNEPCFPSAKTLLNPYVQEQVYRYMFDPSQPNLPPVRYRKRILKTITARVESAIEDPDEDEISDALMNNMAQLCLESPLPHDEAAMQKTIISYFPPLDDAPPIMISESPQLLAAGSNVGLRTWEACLRLSYFLSTEGQSIVKGRKILELGAGTGMLSILCANNLNAKSVMATDGLPEVVASMQRNIALNPKTEPEAVIAEAAHFDWTNSDTFTHSLGLNKVGEWPKYDLILGADITYNSDYFEPLVKALEILLAVNEKAIILIAGAIRNAKTYEVFLDVCDKHSLDVLEIDYKCPPLHQQKGFFHAIALPIKIMNIRRGKALKDGMRTVKLDSELSKFVATNK